jgi:hypothetical protein
MLSLYWRDIKGTRGHSRGTRGYSMALEGYSQAHGVHSGVLRGFSHKTPTCVCGCASFGLYTTYHGPCTARHGSSRRTGSTGGVLDLLLCGPSLRVRLRSDATADDARADALADTADDTLTDAFAHEQNTRAGDRRAGRCSVGYELP